MNKDDAIRRMAAELRAFGWQFVQARDYLAPRYAPYTCKQYAEQDQAATRAGVPWPGVAALEIQRICKAVGA